MISSRVSGPGGRKFWPFLFVVVAIIALLAALAFSSGLTLPDMGILSSYRPYQSIRIYDRFDRLMYVAPSTEDRVVIPYSSISKNMINAIVAAEDRDFFAHGGINVRGLLRALLANLKSGAIVQGGSSITQQLAKNLFCNKEPRTIARKIKELILAWELERAYGKERILSTYLNHVYFGKGVYGVQRAAQRYFGKDASQLRISEAAYLAGLPKAPSLLSNQPEAAHRRQRVILDAMRECGFISQAQLEQAMAEKLHFRSAPYNRFRYPHFNTLVLSKAAQLVPRDRMWACGLKIYTTLDQPAQRAAESVLAKGIAAAPAGVNQGALVSLAVEDGAVLAMVGGVGDFRQHQFNRAISPHTAGSAFKPFVYLAGITGGQITPDTVVFDEPILVRQVGSDDWIPRNFDDRYYGLLSARRALALSRNVCAVRIAHQIGVPKIIETASTAGIESPLDPYLPLALGCSAVSPLEMANAYATFARGGIKVQPRVIRRIEEADGRLLWRPAHVGERVFDDEPVAKLVDVLCEVVRSGTGTAAQLKGRPVAGKTGTSDKSKDIWFIGFTPDLVTAVWGGNDANRPVPGVGVTGGGVMAGIWRRYMTVYYGEHKVVPGQFRKPMQPLKELPDLYYHPLPDFFADTRAALGGWIGDHERTRRWGDHDIEVPESDFAQEHYGEPPRKRRSSVLRRLVERLDRFLDSL